MSAVMDSHLAMLPRLRQDMACGAGAGGSAAAMVNVACSVPVRGFSTQYPLASRALMRRTLRLRAPSVNRWSHVSILAPGRNSSVRIVSAMGEIPWPDIIQSHMELGHHMASKLEGSLFVLADAAASADGALEATQTGAKQASDGWLGGLTDTLEKILIFLKDGLATLKVPYAYGFAIILLTFLVKAATFPLTKSQVQSTIAMQNLQPQLKKIQSRYQGDQERIQLETARLYKQAGVNPLAGCLPTLATLPVWIGLYRALSNVANEGLLTEGFFWIPSLAGPTTVAARQGGSGVAWLFPFQDGLPPLGWADTIAYLVLPVLLVVSQFFSMQIMQPPQTADSSQQSTQILLKFLPLMIGYFALSVPSGLSLYWLTNNILSTAQQVYLRKPKTDDDTSSTLISAGQAKRSAPAPAPAPPAAAAAASSSTETTRSSKESRRGEKFRELKLKEAQRKAAKKESATTTPQAEAGGGGGATSEGSTHDSAESYGKEEGSGSESSNDGDGDDLEVYTNGTGGGKVTSVPKRGKRSKRTRAD